MQEARIGNRARIHYTVTLKSGKTVGSSRGGQPLSFTIGKGKVLKGLEQGIIGMQPGQVKDLEISPEQGYGTRNEDMVMQLDRSKFPADIMLEKGRVVQYRSETQEVVNLLIRDFDDNTITVDANHPLAGETLLYKVHLVSLE